MSLRRFVACGALLVALAHAHASLKAADAAAALSEVATLAVNAFNAWQRRNSLAETPLALTTSRQLEVAMVKIRAKVAQNAVLMKRLACGTGEAGEAGEADAVVCGLARAVHSSVRPGTVVRASRTNKERPFALAALHRWNALPPVAAVAAQDVAAGLALLLGRPGARAVDGAAAFAFRALQSFSATWSVGRRSNLQRAATAATDALAAPATHCHLLLFGDSAARHDAARAAASAMELAICRLTVATHDALWPVRLFSSFRSKCPKCGVPAIAAAHGEAMALLSGAVGGNVAVQVGPVLQGGAGGAEEQEKAEEQNAWPTVAAIAHLLVEAEAAYATSTQLEPTQKRTRKTEQTGSVDSFGPQPQPTNRRAAATMGLTSGGLTLLGTVVERSDAAPQRRSEAAAASDLLLFERPPDPPKKQAVGDEVEKAVECLRQSKQIVAETEKETNDAQEGLREIKRSKQVVSEKEENKKADAANEARWRAFRTETEANAGERRSWHQHRWYSWQTIFWRDWHQDTTENRERVGEGNVRTNSDFFPKKEKTKEASHIDDLSSRLGLVSCGGGPCLK